MCAVVLFPAAGSEGPRWLKIKSPNFELFTTAGERNGREVARHFEQVRAFFLEAMGQGLKSGPPVRIVVFRSDKEFAPYAPNELASAFYLGTDDHDYIIMKGASGENFPVAVHEYTHLLLKHSGMRPPVWFNEGLAEFYSNLKPVAGKVEGGASSCRTIRCCGNRSGSTYRHCWRWSRTHRYITSRAKPRCSMPRVGRWYICYIWATTTGPSCAGCWRASRPAPAWRTRSKRHTGSPWSRWKRTSGRIWARNGLMPRCSTRGWRRPASRRPRRRVHSKSALVLAEIVANAQDKAAQGRELYNGLARDNPRDWRIEEGLARLSRREQKIGEAEQHYARAAELGSTSARMYLDYGRLLRVEDKRAEAVAVLKRATEIDPDDREARLELGYAYVVNDQHAEALAQFQLAKPVAPEHAFEYLHAMAY